MNYNIGDIVELIPGNCPDDFFEGTGIILSTEGGKYLIHFSSLDKTSRKKFYTTHLGSLMYSFDIEMADKNNIFKILD